MKGGGLIGGLLDERGQDRYEKEANTEVCVFHGAHHVLSSSER